jgi:transcription elongation factor Elf1
MIDKELDEIDCDYTDNIICPYCGWEDVDSWENEPGEEDIGLMSCGRCEKEFYAERYISTSYSTKKATYGTCLGCGAKDVVTESYSSTMGKYMELCCSCGKEEIKRLYKTYIESLGVTK